MTLIARPATADDLTDVLSLLGELPPGECPLSPASAARIWKEVSDQHGRALLVSEREGLIAGTVDCLIMPDLARDGHPVMFVENLVVGGRHRRTGVGRSLMRSAERFARDSDCYKVQLLAADDSYVHEFYRSCGFAACPDGFRKYLSPEGVARYR